MNILLGKNESLHFGQMTDRKATWGGFDVCGLHFVKLALAYPEHTFYYVGQGDHAKVSNGWPNNLIDLQEIINKKVSKTIDECYNTKIHNYYDVYKFLESNNYTFDKAIIWYCRFTPIAEYNYGYISPRTGGKRQVLASDMRAAMPFCIIKHFAIPTVYISDDLMDFNKLPWDVPDPVAMYSQFNNVDVSKAFTDKEHWYDRKTDIIYKGIEKLWLQGKKKVDWRNFEKTNRFILTVNCGPYKARYIKKWILDKNPNEIIYGNWTTTPKYITELNDAGIDKDKNIVNKGMSEMEDLMFNTRYTFIIPAQPNPRMEKNRSFLTQKVFSMLYYGIIPFWCSDDYDKSNIYSNFPDYIKVKTPDELYQKMDELDNNETLYRELLNKLYDLLEDKYFDERFIHEIYDDFLNE